MWEPSVNRIIRIGMDTSKSTAWRGCFGTGSAAQAAKKALLEFFAKLPTTVVVIACSWAWQAWSRRKADRAATDEALRAAESGILLFTPHRDALQGFQPASRRRAGLSGCVSLFPD